jgi:hypothetical protein
MISPLVLIAIAVLFALALASPGNEEPSMMVVIQPAAPSNGGCGLVFVLLLLGLAVLFLSAAGLEHVAG